VHYSSSTTLDDRNYLDRSDGSRSTMWLFAGSNGVIRDSRILECRRPEQMADRQHPTSYNRLCTVLSAPPAAWSPRSRWPNAGPRTTLPMRHSRRAKCSTAGAVLYRLEIRSALEKKGGVGDQEMIPAPAHSTISTLRASRSQDPCRRSRWRARDHLRS
jgi:hypothetical protein